MKLIELMGRRPSETGHFIIPVLMLAIFAFSANVALSAMKGNYIFLVINLCLIFVLLSSVANFIFLLSGIRNPAPLSMKVMFGMRGMKLLFKLWSPALPYTSTPEFEQWLLDNKIRGIRILGPDLISEKDLNYMVLSNKNATLTKLRWGNQLIYTAT